jgi:hypothetical protein
MTISEGVDIFCLHVGKALGGATERKLELI